MREIAKRNRKRFFSREEENEAKCLEENKVAIPLKP
jgi:hypothetical protein